MNEGLFNNNEDEILIANSGLIILWPFLTSFFDKLNLIENENFINNESRNRAVYLLQNLVFNNIDFPEYKLILNKLLVGMPLKNHLEPIEQLTKVEEELSLSLLYGLINNWDKVKVSTPKSIQETFINREGILRDGEESFILQVEKRGVDVLLDTIPWNISLIKLPWMSKQINIQWI